MMKLNSMRQIVVFLTICMLDFVVGQATTTKILTLGDQVVIGRLPGGFRTNVYYQLLENGYDVEMVGTQDSNPYSDEMDPHHEGYEDQPISFFDNIDYFKALKELIEAPDVIIVYVGAVDFVQENEVPNIVYMYQNLLSNLATIFPHANIIASTLLGGSSNLYIDKTFNLNLEDRIYELIDLGKKVTIADVAANISSSEMVDGIFPTQVGYDKMANAYVAAIQKVISPELASGVEADGEKPVMVSAINTSNSSIKINFSKPLADESVDKISNFQLEYGIEVKNAILTDSKTSIILITSDFTASAEGEVPLKVIIVGGVIDESGQALANSSLTFLLASSGEGNPSPVSSPVASPTLPPILFNTATLPPAISAGLPQSTTRILCLGDMLTVGGSSPGGYRNHLFDLLTTTHKYNVHMLGTRRLNAGTHPLYHEGWSMKSIQWFIGIFPELLNTVPDPDVILLHMGMVDIIADENPDEDAVSAIYRYQLLILKIFELRPHANIIATNLIQHQFPAVDEKVQSLFNEGIKDAIDDIASRGHKITFLDLRSKVNPYMVKDVNNDIDLTDPEGYKNMANGWLEAILNVIGPHGDLSVPAITKVKALDSYDSIEITFSKPILIDSTRRQQLFSLEYNIQVLESQLDEEKRTVTIKTTNFSFMEGAPLILTVGDNAIKDRTPVGRALPAGTSITFQVPPNVLSSARGGTVAPSPPSSLIYVGGYRGVGGKVSNKSPKSSKGKSKRYPPASSSGTASAPTPVSAPTPRSEVIYTNSNSKSKSGKRKKKKGSKRLR